MIIDFHTHTFPDRIAARAVDNLKHKSHTVPFSDGTVEGLIANQSAAGIGCSVVMPVATNPQQTAHINEAAAQANERYAGSVISFAAIHPDNADYINELKRAVSLGLKGVKIHPVYQGVDIDDLRFLRILDCAASLGLMVLTHSGDDIGYPGVDRCGPKKIRNALRQVGKMPFIAAHMGGWNRWDEVPEQLADLGVFLDTAFSTGVIPAQPEDDYPMAHVSLLDTEGFLKLMQAFGSDHILFGTDSPWGNPAADIAFIRQLPISDVEKEQILYQNAAKLLALQ